MFNFKGKKIIVTGAGSGIGKAIAKRFAEFGGYIAVCDIDANAARQVAREIEILGAKALPYQVDCANYQEVEAVTDKIALDFDGIEILINNAGITRDSLLLRMKEEDFDRVLAVNLKGVFNFTRSVLKYLLKEKWGRIINIASVVGEMGNPGQSNYSAAKAGIIGFTKSVAKEVGARNITVNVVSPGFIITPMTESLPPEIKERYIKSIPLRRAGEPVEVANLCLFLASDYASYITAQVIRIDGGMF